MSVTPHTRAEHFESVERINSVLETNRSFDSCNSCKQLAVYISCISQNCLFQVSNLSVLNLRFFSAHISVVGAESIGVEAVSSIDPVRSPKRFLSISAPTASADSSLWGALSGQPADSAVVYGCWVVVCLGEI